MLNHRIRCIYFTLYSVLIHINLQLLLYRQMNYILSQYWIKKYLAVYIVFKVQTTTLNTTLDKEQLVRKCWAYLWQSFSAREMRARLRIYYCNYPSWEKKSLSMPQFHRHFIHRLSWNIWADLAWRILQRRTYINNSSYTTDRQKGQNFILRGTPLSEKPRKPTIKQINYKTKGRIKFS